MDIKTQQIIIAQKNKMARENLESIRKLMEKSAISRIQAHTAARKARRELYK